MLSILIPTYNYNVLPLVKELHRQATDTPIAFEIIVLDDASPDDTTIKENQKINLISNCSYNILEKNIGRSAIRNLLAKKAYYDWLLFLDADIMPVNGNLISQYLSHLNEGEKVIYGGIRYQGQKPSQNELLRWIYGNDREALPAEKRQQDSYLSLLTLNFAIKKSIFNKVSFNETIPNLRHEDTLFSHDLKSAGIKIEHIDNPVYHLGLESSDIFMRKSEEAVIGLKYLLDNRLLSNNYIKLSSLYASISRFGMTAFVGFLFKTFQKPLKENLLSDNPSLLIFDLYRLGYLCSLK